MRIAGIQKLTLLDYPGKTACTLFTRGCPYRCVYCHNVDLLPFYTPITLPPDIDEDKAIAFLRKRKGLLEGVCLSGGEPLAQDDLPEFLVRVRKLGYAIKLDTNGFYPYQLEEVIQAGLVDYVALDIKNCPAKYAETCGMPGSDVHHTVGRCIQILTRSGVDYEFRTTVVRELHTEEDIVDIAMWLRGQHKYFLQGYVPTPVVLRPDLHPVEKAEMQRFCDIIKPLLPNAALRGV